MSQNCAVERPSASATASREVLNVELAIRPDGTMVCPITDVEGTVDDVRINAIGGRCNSDIRITDESGSTELVRATAEITSNCLCHVFQRHDCVPNIRGVEDDTILVETYVDDRETIRELIAALRRINGSVRLVRLTVGEEGQRGDLVTVDLSTLTAKQREALELAISRGYYDDDRDVSLAEMASELGISKSALSQRLRAVQSKLMGELFTE